MSRKLPKTIYVKWEDENSEDVFLCAIEGLMSHAEMEETVEVGIYNLIEKRKVRNTTEVVEEEVSPETKMERS